MKSQPRIINSLFQPEEETYEQSQILKVSYLKEHYPQATSGIMGIIIYNPYHVLSLLPALELL